MKTAFPATFVLAACLLMGCSTKPREAGAAFEGGLLKAVDGQRLPIGRGRMVVLVSYLPSQTELIREVKFPGGSSRPVPARTLADPDVVLVQLLDVNDRIPKMLSKRIERPLFEKLKKERDRLAREIAAAGFARSDREAKRSLFYAVDMDGVLPKQFGMAYGRDGVATAILDGTGRVIFSRPGAVAPGQVVAALGSARAGRLAGSDPVPSRNMPVVVLRHRGELVETAPPPSSTRATGSEPPPPPQGRTVPPAETSAPPRLPSQDYAPSKVRENDQALLTSLVTGGRPLIFTGNKVVFQPLKPPRQSARPGAFEDAAIEAEVRGRIAANPGLAGRSITVRSRGGMVEIVGKLDDLGIAAAVIDAALATPGVFEVSAHIR